MDWLKKLSSKNPKDWEDVAREIQKKDGSEIKSIPTKMITPRRKITESIPKTKNIKTFKPKKLIKL